MCCGNKRRELVKQQQYSHIDVADNTPPKMWFDVPFQYTGETGLTINGLITGKRYRFSHHGDIEIIDYRDVSSMMAVNKLHKVKN